MSLLKQNTIRKGQVDKNNTTKLDVSKDSNKYKIKITQNGAIDARELKSGHLSGLLSSFFRKII